MKGQHGGAAVLAAALLAVPAFAQDDGAADFRATGVTVRSGITAFTGDLGAETNVGGFLGVQVDAQPLRLMGIEVGYEGSANGF